MSLMDYFRSSRSQPQTAMIAKERLQIIVAHERNHNRSGPDYLPELKEEILRVVRKYVDVDRDHIRLKREREGDYEVLELNITLPDEEESAR